MESKMVKFITENRMVAIRGSEWGKWVKAYKDLVIRWMSSGDLMCSLVTTAKNTGCIIKIYRESRSSVFSKHIHTQLNVNYMRHWI